LWVVANLIVFEVSKSVSNGYQGVGQGIGIFVFGEGIVNFFLLVSAIASAIWIGRTAGAAVLSVFLVVAVLFPSVAIIGVLWLIFPII